MGTERHSDIVALGARRSISRIQGAVICDLRLILQMHSITLLFHKVSRLFREARPGSLWRLVSDDCTLLCEKKSPMPTFMARSLG
jgi:hypothetical protein